MRRAGGHVLRGVGRLGPCPVGPAPCAPGRRRAAGSVVAPERDHLYGPAAAVRTYENAVALVTGPSSSPYAGGRVGAYAVIGRHALGPEPGRRRAAGARDSAPRCRGSLRRTGGGLPGGLGLLGGWRHAGRAGPRTASSRAGAPSAAGTAPRSSRTGSPGPARRPRRRGLLRFGGVAEGGLYGPLATAGDHEGVGEPGRGGFLPGCSGWPTCRRPRVSPSVPPSSAADEGASGKAGTRCAVGGCRMRVRIPAVMPTGIPTVMSAAIPAVTLAESRDFGNRRLELLVSCK